MILSQRRAEVESFSMSRVVSNPSIVSGETRRRKIIPVALTESQDLKAKGKSVRLNSGTETAGIPNRLAGIANVGSPVEVNPTGAGPGADSVMHASQTDANSE
jgi:hypothetical protein